MKKFKAISKKLLAFLLMMAVLLPLAPQIGEAVTLQVEASEEYFSTLDTGKYMVAPVYNDSIYNELKDEWIKYEYAWKRNTMSLGPLFLSEEHPQTQMAWGYSHGEIYNMITGTKVVYEGVGTWDNYSYTRYGYRFSDETVLRIGANSYSDGYIRALNRDMQVLATAKKGYVDVDYLSVAYLQTGMTLTTPYAVAIDNQKPTIENVEMSDFGEIVVSFSENLRPANGNVYFDEYTLNLSYGNARSGAELGTIKYKATGIEGKKMTFVPDGPTPTGGEYIILGIKGSSNGAEDENFDVYGIGQVYAYSLSYDKYYKKHNMVYEYCPLRFIDHVEGRAPVTDLAGNALTIPAALDLKGYNIIIDLQSPEIEKVTLSGSMSPKINEESKDGWGENVDLSTLYAGNDGDKLYFDLHFTEKMSRVGSVTLNVKKNGVSVTLSNPELMTSSNANGDVYTVARYGPFTVSEGMTMAEGQENSWIGVVSISGDFCDLEGNRLSGDTPSSAQKIYLDATPPTVSSSLYSGNGTRELSIKIEMSDTGSGFLGLEGRVGLVAVTEGRVDYKMAITDTMEIPEDSEYIYSGFFKDGSVSWQTIPLYSGTRYIHIKLTGDQSTITVDELKVAYDIPDWAGNRNDSEASRVEPNYAYDEAPPKISNVTASVEYTDTGATVTANWSASDFNAALGITTYYQWRDTRPADYSNGWMSAGEQTEGFAWVLPDEGKPQFDSETDTTLTLWVFAIDKSGNRSEMVSRAVSVLLDKPNYSASISGDVSVPTQDPALKLSLEPSANGEREGYARAFVSFPDHNGRDQAYSYTYAFVLSSTDTASGTVDLFPLGASGLSARSVYRIRLNEDESEILEVTEISAEAMDELMSAWYGEVRVWFDLAYDESADPKDNALVPKTGSLSALVTDGSYYRSEEEYSFLVSCDVENIYSAEFANYADKDGEGFEGDKMFYQTLGGVSLEITINNLYRPERGILDVDFNESYISVVKVNGDGSLGDEFATAPISSEATQRVTIPGAIFETAAYAIVLNLVMKDGQRMTVADDICLVVDKVTTTAGVTETYVTPNLPISAVSSMPTLTRFDENGHPYLEKGTTGVNSNLTLTDLTVFVIRNRAEEGYIGKMTVSMAGQSEAIRSDTYTNEVGGAANFGFTVTAKNAEHDVAGFTVGKIAAIYVWNPAIHENREQGFVTSDGYYTYNSENAVDHDTWTYDEITGIGKSTLNKNEAGVYTMAEQIGLADGNNVICYQVVMENGIECPVEQFMIYVNTETPKASLDVSVLEEKMNLAEEGESKNVARADVKLQNIFTTSNIYGTYYLTKDVLGLLGYSEGADGGVEEIYTETKYSQIDTLNALNSGYYPEWKYNNFVMYNANRGEYTDAAGNQVSSTGRRLEYQYAKYYRMYPIAADATVRLFGDNSRVYMTSAAGVEMECVTYKFSSNEYAASGAFLVLDESGACVLVFPQLAPTADAYSDPKVEGYQPKYRLNDSLVEYRDVLKTGSCYNIDNGRMDMVAWINNGRFIDKSRSYVTFTDAEGNEVERFYFDESYADPNSVGYYHGYINLDGINSVGLELQNPLASGAHSVGERVESVWAQLVLYDANTDREVVSNIAEVTHQDRVYEEPVPEPYWLDDYDGLRLHWNTSVKVGDGESDGFNHHLNIFEDGDHKITVTDWFGVTQTVTVTTTHFAKFAAPKVEIDNTKKTTSPVTVTFTLPEGAVYSEIFVTGDEDKVTIVDSGSGRVTATFKESATVTVSWDLTPDVSDAYMSYELEIDNILPVELGVRWDYGENAEDYIGGDVIAYVYDKNGNWDIIDPMTGKRPTYTFVEGSGIEEYTFMSVSNGELLAEGIYNDLGELTVKLEVELKSIPTPPPTEIDTRAPSVQIIPYAMRNQTAVSRESYLIYEDLDGRAQTGDGNYVDLLNPALVPYEGYTEYTDAAEFTESLGWASRFRFNIEVQDVNRAKIVIKRGLYADAPDSYHTATSDSIENVMLLGNTIEVTGPAQFTLFVIDEMGNLTAFNMDLYNVGNAPVPSYLKLPAMKDGENAIEVALTAPEEGTELEIVAVDGKAAEEAVFTKNGSYTISYTYVYKGEPVEGELRIEINEIDNEAPYLVKKKWSASSGSRTRGDVTLTLTFNKPIDSVRVDRGADNIPDEVKANIVGNTVTLRYTENCDALVFSFKAFNGMWSEAVAVEAVESIDRNAPVITVGELLYSADAKNATVTLTSNEAVSFRDGGSSGTQFLRKFSQNGLYEYSFVDAAGNQATVTVSVTGIVDTLPTLSFSKQSNGSGAVASPDALGEVTFGDVFYVSVDRDATISFNGEEHEVTAGEWLELTVGDRSGGSIYARDAYGNKIGAVFTSIGYPDLTAPRIELASYAVRVSLLDLSGLDEAIRENAIAVDDIDGNIAVEVEYEIPDMAGDFAVTYRARDNSGNETVVTGIIRVYEDTVPGVFIDSVFVERESIFLADSQSQLNLKVDMQSEPFEITWMQGIRTAAQMKIHATSLEDSNGEAELPFAGESGYFTVLVTTQSHDAYRIIIYIK